MMGDVVSPPWEQEVLVVAWSKLRGCSFPREPVCPEGVSRELQAQTLGAHGPRLNRESDLRREKYWSQDSNVVVTLHSSSSSSSLSFSSSSPSFGCVSLPRFSARMWH